MRVEFVEQDIPIQDIDYTITPIVPAILYDKNGTGSPEEGGDITIHHVWRELQSNKFNDDKFVDVDILPLLDYNSLIDRIQEYEREKI